MLAIEMAGDGLIGEKHELLDQLMGFVGGLLLDPVGAAAFVEQNAEFGKIQIQRAGGKTPFPQSRGKGPCLLEKAVEIVRRRAMEAKLGLLIGETVPGEDHRSGKARGANPAVRPDPDKGGVSQALFPGPQGAKVVGEAGREHGDDAIDEIDAVGAATGLFVEDGSGADVMGDIGDVDADLGVAAGELTEGDGIVEVAGGVGIDGDDEFGPQVLAIRRLLGQFHHGKGGSFGEGLGGKLRGEVELADDGKDVDARILAAAEPLDDDPFRIGVAILPFGKPGNDLVSGGG